MTTQQSEGTVQSADGTWIGFLKLGTGPGLVIVHGSLTTGDEWIPVASLLAHRFTCFLLDRRGCGRSGDNPEYSLSKECEDIKAVLDAAGPNPCLLGHSYGAICTLETARAFSVAKLTLYEPPLPIHDAIVGPAFEDFRSAVRRNELDEALTIGLRDLVKMSDDEVTGLRTTPLWAVMSALTPTWTREIQEIKQLEFGVARFSGIVSPTLLLIGSVTARHHVVASNALEEALPDARSVRLEGHGHQAHLTATAVFANAVANFLGN